ncbi:MAG: (d)CMP kinase [Xanthobacteraceae bacterium]|nr:(d)CMP kinase [Xanthobacteraceae bacterium]MCW5673294.1 (d)CMP kinase [Xanthobacteraceae bacterium]
MIITVDGPAASGKGTLAKKLAAHYGLPHLDTGLLYRGVGYLMMQSGHALDDAAMAARVAQELDLFKIDQEHLRSDEVGEAASKVAAIPGVRAALLKLQQDFARQPGGAVLDGRDTGTVIAPDADVKLFVTASPEVRAKRRHIELAARRTPVEYCAVISDIKKRDERDSERSIAPLKPAPDAVLLDTTDLDIEAAFRAAIEIVEAPRAGRTRP